MKTFEYLISFSNLDWEIKISENKGKILQKYFWFFSVKKGQLLNNIQNMFAKLSCTTFQSLKLICVLWKRIEDEGDLHKTSYSFWKDSTKKAHI